MCPFPFVLGVRTKPQVTAVMKLVMWMINKDHLRFSPINKIWACFNLHPQLCTSSALSQRDTQNTVKSSAGTQCLGWVSARPGTGSHAEQRSSTEWWRRRRSGGGGEQGWGLASLSNALTAALSPHHTPLRTEIFQDHFHCPILLSNRNVISSGKSLFRFELVLNDLPMQWNVDKANKNKTMIVECDCQSTVLKIWLN